MGAVVAYTFFLPGRPTGWPDPVSANLLGCPTRAGVRSASSFGSTKFFSLPLGAPSEGARLRVDLGGSQHAYALFLGRGCPADPASFQCVAATQIACASEACVAAGVLDYAFGDADASTSVWYLALTSIHHAVGSGGLRWRAEGKFLPATAQAALSFPPPAASPSPLPGDPSLRVQDLGGDFFPFGPGAGDATLGRSDDGALRLALPAPLPAFASYFDAAWVSVDGWVSLGARQSAAGSRGQLPRDRSAPALVAPLWADADTRAGPSPGSTRPGAVPDNSVYARTARRSTRPGATLPSDALLLDAATARVRALFASAQGAFLAQSALVATWHAVAPWPASATANGALAAPRNTFQATLITDGLRSYVLLAYGGLGWAAGPGGTALLPNGSAGWMPPGPPCAVLHAGGGLPGNGRQVAPGGCTGASPASAAALLGSLATGSNVGTAGRWAFRIDDVGSGGGGGGCAESPEELDSYASVAPRAGSQLGGTLVFLSGPCLPERPTLSCRFGEVVVPARRLSTYSLIAVCSTPFSPVAKEVNVSLGVAFSAGAPPVWARLGVFAFVRPDSHALPALAMRVSASSNGSSGSGSGGLLRGTRNVTCSAAPSPGATPAPRTRSELPAGLAAPGDLLQLAWFLPADVVAAAGAGAAASSSSSAPLNFTLEFWEVRVGGQPALCPAPSGASAGTGTRGGLPRGPLSAALAAPPRLVSACHDGSSPGAGADSGAPCVRLQPDVPPDDPGLPPSRFLASAALPAPDSSPDCLRLLFARARTGAPPEAAPPAAEADLTSGLLPLLGAGNVAGAVAGAGTAWDLRPLCAAARALLPRLPPPREWGVTRASAAQSSGLPACPLDARDAASAPGVWRGDPGCPADARAI